MFLIIFPSPTASTAGTDSQSPLGSQELEEMHPSARGRGSKRGALSRGLSQPPVKWGCGAPALVGQACGNAGFHSSPPPGSAGQRGRGVMRGVWRGLAGCPWANPADAGQSRPSSRGGRKVIWRTAREAPGPHRLFCWFVFRVLRILE